MNRKKANRVARTALCTAFALNATLAAAQSSALTDPTAVNDLLMTPQLQSLATHVPDPRCLSPLKSLFYNDPYTSFRLFQTASLFETEARLNERGVDAVLFGCHLLHELQQQQKSSNAKPVFFPAPAEQFDQV